MRMLTIDDKNFTTDLDRAGYKQLGVIILKAANYSEADTILSKDTVDIIVINFDYKEINAIDLCNHFKANKKTSEVPVVFTSFENQPRTVKKLLNTGLDLFVELPIPRDYFIEKLRSVLEQSTRKTNRVVHDGLVSFSLNGEEITCGIADVSNSGILLSTQLDIAANTNLDISFSLPGYKKPIKVMGEVVRKIDDQSNPDVQIGIGVRFKDFLGDSKKRLEKYISKSQSDDPKLAYYL